MNPVEHAVLKVAALEMDKWGLVEKGWQVVLDRATSRAGMCSFSKREISLSRHMINLNAQDNMAEVLATIRHEIAHAMAGVEYGPRGNRIYHGDRWKACAILVGCEPNRCYSRDDLNMPPRRKREARNVIAECCDKTYRRARMPRRNAMSYKICVSCRSRLYWYRVA